MKKCAKRKKHDEEIWTWDYVSLKAAEKFLAEHPDLVERYKSIYPDKELYVLIVGDDKDGVDLAGIYHDRTKLAQIAWERHSNKKLKAVVPLDLCYADEEKDVKLNCRR
jgi:hypothetical protein